MIDHSISTTFYRTVDPTIRLHHDPSAAARISDIANLFDPAVHLGPVPKPTPPSDHTPLGGVVRFKRPSLPERV
jgi:hypothetical protein